MNQDLENFVEKLRERGFPLPLGHKYFYDGTLFYVETIVCHHDTEKHIALYGYVHNMITGKSFNWNYNVYTDSIKDWFIVDVNDKNNANITNKPVCTCGSHKTYGINCNKNQHSDWCDLLRSTK